MDTKPTQILVGTLSIVDYIRLYIIQCIGTYFLRTNTDVSDVEPLYTSSIIQMNLVELLLHYRLTAYHTDHSISICSLLIW